MNTSIVIFLKGTPSTANQQELIDCYDYEKAISEIPRRNNNPEYASDNTALHSLIK